MSPDERIELLDTLIAAGVPPEKLMPGTGACALTDSAKLAAHAAGKGCGGVLMLPPFYYKDVNDEGIFAFVSEVIQRVGSGDLRIYLYHIPPIAQVSFNPDLIERLINAYAKTVVGIKDSSGKWANTEMLLKQFPGFGVFVGSESFLLDTLRGGGSGCISATANVNAAAIKNLFLNWRSAGAEDLQQQIARIRKTIEAYPLIASLKFTIAHFFNDPAWRQVRPPLRMFPEQQQQKLLAELAQLNFSVSFSSSSMDR